MTRFEIPKTTGHEETVSSHVYVIYQNNWGKPEVIGTAFTPEERDQKCKAADFIPKSGMTFWVKYTTRAGKGNCGCRR